MGQGIVAYWTPGEKGALARDHSVQGNLSEPVVEVWQFDLAGNHSSPFDPQ